jgi:hypothetical protein
MTTPEVISLAMVIYVRDRLSMCIEDWPGT